MSGGAYAALSGMQSKLSDLDRLASDLANIGTAGYKTERSAAFASERDFATELQSAVDVSTASGRIDLTPGTISNTGRSLDVAIEGSEGFFAIETSHGVRYTRSGNFTRRADGVLATVDGEPVLDAQNKRITLGSGIADIDADGNVSAGGSVVGRIPVYRIDERNLIRENGARFRPSAGVKPQAATDIALVPGALEQANVSVVDRMVALTELTRTFEALQKGISVLTNDIDSRAIVELGRR